MLTNHQKQKKWCKERLNYSMEQWKMIIFSDESNFKIINRQTKDLFVTKIPIINLQKSK